MPLDRESIPIPFRASASATMDYRARGSWIGNARRRLGKAGYGGSDVTFLLCPRGRVSVVYQLLFRLASAAVVHYFEAVRPKWQQCGQISGLKCFFLRHSGSARVK